MITRPLIVFGLTCVAGTAFAGTKMTVGDGLIDGHRLSPYQITWRQCSFQDDKWSDQGALTEELAAVDERVVRHRQSVQRPDGTTGQSVTYFDRATFAPLRMEKELTRDGERLAYTERLLDADGYTGIAFQGEDAKKLNGVITSNMLHGGAMGLPLATMDYQKARVEFLASMVDFDGTYVVSADWVGREYLEFGGQKIETWLIDIEWNHRESGDIYPPGPDASGGRYWVVREPPDGFPYVPRYKTDTYAVEFDEGGVCPSGSDTAP